MPRFSVSLTSQETMQHAFCIPAMAPALLDCVIKNLTTRQDCYAEWFLCCFRRVMDCIFPYLLFSGLHTCADLKRTGAGKFDGEYLLYPKRACSSPVKVYCHGMETSYPRDYLTLPAGPINNFAIVYDRRLRSEDRHSCTGALSPLRYSKAGKTKFHKV